MYSKKLMALLSTTFGDQFSNRIGKIKKLKISLRVIGKQYNNFHLEYILAAVIERSLNQPDSEH